MLLFGVIARDFGSSTGDVNGLLAAVGDVRSGPVRLLVLVEADHAALQHNTDLVPRSENKSELYITNLDEIWYSSCNE